MSVHDLFKVLLGLLVPHDVCYSGAEDESHEVFVQSSDADRLETRPTILNTRRSLARSLTSTAYDEFLELLKHNNL